VAQAIRGRQPGCGEGGGSRGARLAVSLSDEGNQELQRLFDKKTLEAEILKEAVEYGRSKKLDCALALTARG
jgi:hypothetical protein